MAQESWKKETDETECQTPEGPILCANNCGFFGSAATNNFCSKCYGDLFMKQKQQQQILKATPVIPVAHEMPIKFTLVQQEPVLEKVDSVGEGCGLKEGSFLCQEAAYLPPNHCMSCRKRVGLTGFKCRCGGIFCAFHRYSEKHECSFDYKSAGRDAIAKANPVVKAEKIEKI
ncbi:zinc finger A20 and AN1 domain-containing stress-associated protein 6-like [Macadamia integrifolia]|uniref:zinc finger A20 and AN1 domain-containing stress-associated protein 6-like n=1 Tax=Macadamia integrifolia TaxID=60698 RepID=UPI001C4F5276|nr:zinc finger A20 and AN1 domain-containing stress-associated protein 6-like [Macadamia integrifolia]